MKELRIQYQGEPWRILFAFDPLRQAIARQEAIETRVSQIRLEEIALRHLREKLGLSQSELAERLEVQQPAISKLERRQNLELNTLRSVVNALGGTIEIIVRVPDKDPILLSDYQE